MVLVCVVMVVVHIDIDLEVTHTPPSEHATKCKSNCNSTL